MTNEEQKLREIVERWMGKKHPITMRSYVSDLTALISEHYVAKAAYIALENTLAKAEAKNLELLRQRDELKGVVKSLIDWDGKFPIAKIYNYNEAEELEADITSIVKAAKAAIKNTEKK